MKRFLIIILAASASLNVWSQDGVKNNRFGLFITYDKYLSTKHIEYGEFNSNVIEFNYDKNNYKIGLKTEHGLNNIFTINSGINFSNKSHSRTDYNKNVDYLIFPPIPRPIKIHLLEVPLSFKYLIHNRELKIYTDIGVINQLRIQRENVGNKYIISGKIAGGIEFNLDEKMALQFITEYNHGLKSLYDDYDYKIKSISFGISLIKTK